MLLHIIGSRANAKETDGGGGGERGRREEGGGERLHQPSLANGLLSQSVSLRVRQCQRSPHLRNMGEPTQWP